MQFSNKIKFLLLAAVTSFFVSACEEGNIKVVSVEPSAESAHVTPQSFVTITMKAPKAAENRFLTGDYFRIRRVKKVKDDEKAGTKDEKSDAASKTTNTQKGKKTTAAGKEDAESKKSSRRDRKDRSQDLPVSVRMTDVDEDAADAETAGGVEFKIEIRPLVLLETDHKYEVFISPDFAIGPDKMPLLGHTSSFIVRAGLKEDRKKRISVRRLFPLLALGQEDQDDKSDGDEKGAADAVDESQDQDEEASQDQADENEEAKEDEESKSTSERPIRRRYRGKLQSTVVHPDQQFEITFDSPVSDAREVKKWITVKATVGARQTPVDFDIFLAEQGKEETARLKTFIVEPHVSLEPGSDLTFFVNPKGGRRVGGRFRIDDSASYQDVEGRYLTKKRLGSSFWVNIEDETDIVDLAE